MLYFSFCNLDVIKVVNDSIFCSYSLCMGKSKLEISHVFWWIVH